MLPNSRINVCFVLFLFVSLFLLFLFLWGGGCYYENKCTSILIIPSKDVGLHKYYLCGGVFLKSSSLYELKIVENLDFLTMLHITLGSSFHLHPSRCSRTTLATPHLWGHVCR